MHSNLGTVGRRPSYPYTHARPFRGHEALADGHINGLQTAASQWESSGEELLL
jgi:hypothetical protein